MYVQPESDAEAMLIKCELESVFQQSLQGKPLRSSFERLLMSFLSSVDYLSVKI